MWLQYNALHWGLNAGLGGGADGGVGAAPGVKVASGGATATFHGAVLSRVGPVNRLRAEKAEQGDESMLGRGKKSKGDYCTWTQQRAALTRLPGIIQYGASIALCTGSSYIRPV